MTTEQLMDAIEVIDDSYIAKYTRGLPKKSQIHWGLISAAACFCLMVTSVIFVLSSGLIPAIPGIDTRKLHNAWQYVYPHSGALTGSGYYHMESGNCLWYADLNTGENSILCSVPDCGHNSSCDAYIQASDKGVLYHNGYLYYYGQDDGTFHRRSADGTGQITYEEPPCVVDADDFAIAGQYLYYTGWAGGDTPELTEYRLVRMHLATGESEVIWKKAMSRDETKRRLKLLAVQDTGALFLWSEDDLTDTCAEAAPMHITFWDSVAGTGVDLLQKPRQELLKVHLVTDGKLYFTGKGSDGEVPDIKVYNLVTGREKTAFKNASMTALGGGYAALHKAEDDWSVIRLPDGAQLPGETVRPDLCAVSADGLALYQTVYSEEPPGEVTQKIYYYLPYAAMADGIQENDLIKLYASSYGYGASQ